MLQRNGLRLDVIIGVLVVPISIEADPGTTAVVLCAGHARRARAKLYATTELLEFLVGQWTSNDSVYRAQLVIVHIANLRNISLIRTD
jgi:hypothetical protein